MINIKRVPNLRIYLKKKYGPSFSDNRKYPNGYLQILNSAFLILSSVLNFSCNEGQEAQIPKTTFHKNSNGHHVNTTFKYFKSGYLLKKESVKGFLNTYSYDSNLVFDSIVSRTVIFRDSMPYGVITKNYQYTDNSPIKIDYMDIELMVQQEDVKPRGQKTMY